jgi:hypothetical protein
MWKLKFTEVDESAHCLQVNKDKIEFEPVFA